MTRSMNATNRTDIDFCRRPIRDLDHLGREHRPISSTYLDWLGGAVS